MSLNLRTNPEVEAVFNKHPENIRQKLLNLRQLIIDTAEEIEDLTILEETLKWGEPSYIAKRGSTIRISRKKNDPDLYGMYFQCTSQLVPTFKMVYGDVFTFEGNRAIVFNVKDELPEAELKRCISVGLTYHKVKKEFLLGM